LQRPATTYLWAQRPAEEADLMRMVAAVQERGPGGDGALSRPVYDAPHAVRPWGWRVSAYLWTKSIAAGALLVAGLAGSTWWGALALTVAPAISLFFLMLTLVLLVVDLKRPDRFAYILLKPNWRSWLVWGAWILMAFGVVGALWLLGGLRGSGPPGILTIATILLSLAAAGYSAFLFGQAEGRDFWQSPLVLPHLVVAAMVAGTAVLLLASFVVPIGPADQFSRGPELLDPREVLWRLHAALGPLLWLSLLVHGALLLIELLSRHPTHDVALAARLLTRGAYRVRFWVGVVLVGTVLPMLALLVGAFSGPMSFTALAALLALAGLWLWEDLWVKAGQSVPLS
jgi:formate-dependent nitrite reductase membrane component NrfD